MNQTVNKHIERKPTVCGGKPCVAGTRIRVQDIYVWHELQGQSPDEIVSRFPQLTMADVYFSLAFFWENRAEILQQMQEDSLVVENLKSKFPSPLQQKLAGKNGPNNPVSS